MNLQDDGIFKSLEREENVKLTLIWGVHFNYHQAERGPVIDFRTPSGSQWMSRLDAEGGMDAKRSCGARD